MAASAPRRLLWVVNHKTLLPAEVPILRSLGWEVFIPKVVPDHDPGFRSAAVAYDYDAGLGLPDTALQVLNRHDFYERSWSPTVAGIVNTQFQVVVTHLSYYVTPLAEAARKFPGRIIARAFGREAPRTYTEFATLRSCPTLLSDLKAVGERFTFGQGYDNLAEIEAPELRDRAHTITVPLPADIFRHRGRWRGGGPSAVFLCPSIAPGNYYGTIYEGIKRDFGGLPHVIFGRQNIELPDPAVLPYLTEAELVELYATAPVFCYPHTEPRHIHYSPLEAVVVGTPTLYLRGALMDMLAEGADLPAACADTAEMAAKARRLIEGDAGLAEAIRATQGRVLDAFDAGLARRQWAAALPDTALPGAVAGA
jgi:hypothetical protein